MGVIIGLLVTAVYVFFIVMFYRLVRAVEKISDNIEKGIVIKKEDATS
jgi:hypothetical protein